MSVTCREAEPDDLTDILALYSELSVGDVLPSPEEARATWETLLNAETTTVHVAQSDGRVVSTCILVIVPNLTRNQRPFALIENVVTSAAMRGQGIGRRVIQAAIAQAWAAGCYKVMLMTGRSDPAVLGFYESCGFEQSKTAFQIRRPDDHPVT